MNGYPRLYIGQNTVAEFKKRVKYPIVQVTDGDTLKQLVDRYHAITCMPYPLIIEDVSYIDPYQQNFLLKFIEDSPLKIILLSSYDGVISTIVSRMSLVYKSPTEVKCNFTSVSAGDQRVLNRMSENTSSLDKIRFQSEECPILYYYDSIVKNHKMREVLK